MMRGYSKWLADMADGKLRFAYKETLNPFLKNRRLSYSEFDPIHKIYDEGIFKMACGHG